MGSNPTLFAIVGTENPFRFIVWRALFLAIRGIIGDRAEVGLAEGVAILVECEAVREVGMYK